MKTKVIFPVLLVTILAFAVSSVSAQHVAVGIGVGVGYAPPPPVYTYAPPPYPPATYYTTPSPGPNYAWIGGYYYPYHGRYAWRAGYWAPRPYAGAVWVAPRYAHSRYYYGYWRR